jgi:hypothetical protein
MSVFYLIFIHKIREGGLEDLKNFLFGYSFVNLI